jgi:hypothetical protein
MGLFSNDANKTNARLGKRKANKKIQKAKKDLAKTNKVSTQQLKAAEDKGTKALYKGRDLGIDYIDKGVQDAVAKDQQALDLYGPIQEQANAGAAKYGNFYGLGGAAGTAEAGEDWRGSEQYKAYSGQNELLMQQLDRQAAARGNPYNATDYAKYGGQLAGAHLGDYIGGLRPYLDQQQQLLGQQANILNNTGNRLYGGGIAQGGLAYGTGQNIANLAQGIGNIQTTGVNVPLAQSRAALTSQQGQNEADMFANITQANNAAMQNQWNAINSGLGALGTLGGAYLGKPVA